MWGQPKIWPADSPNTKPGLAAEQPRSFGPLELVYSEPHPDRASAVKRERQLKRWSRAKKLALIKGNTAELKRLAQCRSTQPPEQFAR